MTRARQIAIYGAGGHARELAWLLSESKGNEAHELVAFVEDGAKPGKMIAGVPVVTWTRVCAAYPSALMVVAVGEPKARERLVRRCIHKEFKFLRLIHRSVATSRSVELGTGAVICRGTILTVDISIGNHVHINVGCTISHDVRIGDFTYLAPGVHVSGNVYIGQRVYIGTGVSIIDGMANEPLRIGDCSVVGAGACVTSSIEANALYAGVPAVLKKRYAG